MQTARSLGALALTSVVLSLSACGGGGGGSSTATAVPTTSAFVSVSSTVASNLYPTAYTATTQLPAVNDQCVLALSTVSYPAAYAGQYALPQKPAGETLKTIPLGIAPVDNWTSAEIPAAVDNPNLNSGCTTTMRDGFLETIQRIKALGAKYVMVYQYGDIDSVANPTTVVKVNISDADLAWMAQQAQAAGLQIRLSLEVNGIDGSGNPLPVPPNITTTWYNQFFGVWSTFAQHEATVAQSAGYATMYLNWTGGWVPVDTTNSATDTAVYNSLATLSTNLRTVFTGKLVWLDWGIVPPASLFPSFDIVDASIGGLSSQPAGQYTLPGLKTAYDNGFSFLKSEWGTKPIALSLMVPSYQNALSAGATFQGYACTNCNLSTLPAADFSVQALAYEALLEDIYANTHTINFDSIYSSNYWFTDTMQPNSDTGLPNISSGIRNKPAESLVYQWWN